MNMMKNYLPGPGMAVPVSPLSPQHPLRRVLMSSLTGPHARIVASAQRCKSQALSGVYALFSLADPLRIRYVGSSTDIRHRFHQHKDGVGARMLGGELGCAVLQLTKFTSTDDRRIVESSWIHTLRKAGHADLNRALLEVSAS